MKRLITAFVAGLMIASTALGASAASFEADEGRAIKAPFIAKGNTYHPDTTKLYTFDTKSLNVFANNGDSKYSRMYEPQWIVGKSGEDGDYAPYFKSKVNDAFTNNSTANEGNREQLYLIYDVNLKNTICDWQNDQVFEFDIKADNANGRLGLMMWYMWASGYHILKEDGKISGTDYVYPVGEWFHIRMVFKNHYWNVYVTDSEGEHHIVDNVKATGTAKPANTWSQGSRMAFLFSQPNQVESEDDRMGFAIDNLHVYREYGEGEDISGFVGISYADGSGTEITELADDGRIILDFGAANETVTADTDNIILTDSAGNAVEYSGENTGEGYVIIPAHKLTQASEYTIRISDEIRKVLNPDLPPVGTLAVRVRDDRVFVLNDVTVSSGSLEADSKVTFTAAIDNRIADAAYLGLVACVYDSDGGLGAISRKNFYAESGTDEDEVELALPSDYDESYSVKVFLVPGDGIRVWDEINIQ